MMLTPTPILILTNDLSVREALKRAAEEFGPVVLTPKPALAIYFAAVHEPALAILDFDAVPLQGRSGLVSTLRVRFQVSLVAVGDDTASADARSFGLPWLAKPIDHGQLMAAIDQIRQEQSHHPKGRAEGSGR